MAPTQDWGFEIDGLIVEEAEGYCLTEGPSGFGSFEHRAFEQNRSTYPGDVSGTDVIAARTFSFSLLVHVGGVNGRELSQRAKFAGSTPLVRALARAFSPITTTETTLDIKVPGAPTPDEILRYYGHPRGMTGNYASTLWAGYVPVLANFRCLDPLGYGPVETVTDAASPLTFTTITDVMSDRFNITISGSGGVPSLTSTTDDGLTVAFQVPLAIGESAVLNFRTHEVSVNGTPAYDRLAPGPLWFRVAPGANSITFTGCASVQIDYRDALLL